MRRPGLQHALLLTARNLFVVATMALITMPIAADAVCTCLNNASVFDIDTNTGGTDGEFSDRIIINAPNGQTWTVTAETGAFDAFNIPPIGVQSAHVPVATDGSVVLMPTGANQYILDFVHVESVGYSITVTNQAGVTLTVANTCKYPDPLFVPPIASAYKNTDPAVTLGAQSASPPPLASATFTIDGLPQTQLVPAFLSPLPTTHTVELTATGSVGNGFQACEQRVRKAFAIVNLTPVPIMDARAIGILVIVLLVSGSRMLRRS